MAPNERWDVVVLGGVNWDYLIRGERLPRPGDTVQGEAFQEACGGKGANQAVAAARLGARVAFVGSVGRDTRGDTMLQALEAEGIDVAHVSRDPERASGAAAIQVDHRGQKQILVAPGANLALTPERARAAAATIQGARVLLMQLEVPIETVVEASRIAHASAVPIVLDPAPAQPLPDELVARLSVVRPNAGEAEVLTGVHVEDEASARRAARVLLDRGARTVAVQAGDHGNLLVWRDGETFVEHVPVQSIDATGAGDAFAAALAVAQVEQMPWDRAGRFASAAAALKTTRLGAQAGLPTRDEVERLLSDLRRGSRAGLGGPPHDSPHPEA